MTYSVEFWTYLVIISLFSVKKKELTKNFVNSLDNFRLFSDNVGKSHP